MICGQCQTENEAERKFCMECGARLATGCPNCGAQNPDAAKFCGECGTTLGDAASPATPTGTSAPDAVRATSGAERRLVTVLFADLVGFTTLAEDLDPEDTRDFLTRYFDLTRTIVERYGGTVEKFIGDAVMAVWGAPTAHEDDAERAVRAALEIVSSVPTLADTFSAQVRAGVLTGETAVTIGATGQGMVAGDIVNTASRLQSVAPPGTVLVGEATYRAAGEAITFERAVDQVLKGKQSPVPAWRAVAVVALRGGSGRSGALEPPFTGRDEELRLLKDLFHASEREGKARLATVVGQGGIGKSRLVWEFEKYIDGVVDTVWWHNGRSPAYGEGISYWALAEMVRGRAGIADTDEPSVARSRLAAAVTEWLGDEQERRWVEPRLAALLALEPMPPGSRDELFAAWRTFFERVAERGPTVMVFEDLQWADDGMLDFVAELLDRSRNRPIFVITLARLELNERRPGWSSSLRNLTQMGLEPLEPAQMAEMVRGTVPGIPDQATNAIVERAEGVPLYAVETIRMLIDTGDLLPTDDGRYEMRSTLEHMAVPETLHALIAARLDSLGDSDRRLIQTAAVVGQSFTADALATVAAEPVDGVHDRLAAMVLRQLLTVETDPRSPERGQYQFVQGVVREVAEGSLSRTDRRALHVAAARYYESLGDAELAGVLASHYVDAYKATPPGPEADALAAQARVSLRAAAERAVSLHSHKQALAYFEQALAVTTDREEMVSLHERAAYAANLSGLFDAAMGHAQAVETISRDAGDPIGVLRGATSQAFVHMGQHGERPAIAVLRPALEAVADRKPTIEIVRAQAELGRALMIGNEYAESVQWSDRVLAAPDVATDNELIEAMVTKGTALGSLGSTLEGEVLLRGAMETADRKGFAFTAVRARNNVLSFLDNFDVAHELIDEGYELSERYGLRTWAYQFAHVSLTNSFERGDWEYGMARAEALDAPGFYGAYFEFERALRRAFRGDIDSAHAGIRRGSQLAGTDSSQATASARLLEATIEFAAANFDAVMPAARDGWSHHDSGDASTLVAMAVAVAVNKHSWAVEARDAFLGLGRRGTLADGQTDAIEVGVLLTDGRWVEARSKYLRSKQNLQAASAAFWLALLNISVGSRAAGQFPEAAEAMTATEEFFRGVGAESFVERYRAAFVQPSADAVASPAASSERAGTAAAS